jgi:predicted unusual protein kinase regulating ubiquinone biosynthesis (AarF/ABC1/UbiB family)
MDGDDGSGSSDTNKIGIIDFGIVYFLTDEESNKLFDIIFLSVSTNNNVNNLKNTSKILKILIQLVCLNERQQKIIFEQVKKDKEFEYLIEATNYSANMIIRIVNKFMSLDNVELKSSICQLVLSSMSGLQTIEYANNNMNLTDLTKSFMNRSIHMD